MATRTVQTFLRNPATLIPLPDWKTTVRLVVPSFDHNHYEIIRSSTVISASKTADSPGLLSAVLEVNADITKPAGTYYTWNVASGITWHFIVPAGDVNTPVWLEDCLTTDPTQPLPAGAASQAELDAFEALVSSTYAAAPRLALDADGVYFPAQSPGMALDADGTYYYSAGFPAVAKVVLDADGVPYPVAI